MTMTMMNPQLTIHSTIQDVLDKAVEVNASDILMNDNSPIMMKIQGVLTEMTDQALNDKVIRALIHGMCNDAEFAFIEQNRGADFATSTTRARFRVNVFFQQNTMASVLRIIPNEIKSAEELGTPLPLIQQSTATKGLILVTGPTGSGKSTTLASLIDHINSTRACHILTLEDPIEFTHERKLAVINQRNLGTDFLSWGDGLRAAMRQAPDVILIGEMRDKETVEAAMKAAETGHLVMGTLHTNGAAETINRIVDFYPTDAHAQIRSQIASNIRAIMSQNLIYSQKHSKRIMAYELMIRTNAIVSLIKDGKVAQIQQMIETGKQIGMKQMDKMLAEYVMDGTITQEQGLERATNPSGFLDMIGQGSNKDNRPI